MSRPTSHQTPSTRILSLRRVTPRSRVASLLFVSSLQYFVVQYVVAADWPRPYSLTVNTISDLGNTACGGFHGHFVCSPLHSVMNISFVILGVTMFAGALVLGLDRTRTRERTLGLSFMGIAGAGVIVVGLCPENTRPTLHAWGASLPFLVGNVGLVVLGVSLDLDRPARFFTVLTGVATLVALLLYSRDQYLGLGEGGMERVVAYPQTMWLILFGASLCKSPPRESTATIATRRHS